MSQRHFNANGHEPGLGGCHVLTGMEPALARSSGGPFRVKGLEAPGVPVRRCPLVLLAECDPDVAELSTLLAVSNGYQVRLTDAGAQAWQLAQALKPDLLVTNRRLKGIDGLDLLRHLRAEPQPELGELPVLVMDVCHGPQEVRTAFQCGADDYLAIPYDLTDMLRCWRRLLVACHRPAPLTALQNDDETIRQVALFDLLDRRPDGLVDGLGEYLWHPDFALKAVTERALRRIGTDEALAVLERHRAVL
jgi:CheY-like chemotaxis protein